MIDENMKETEELAQGIEETEMTELEDKAIEDVSGGGDINFYCPQQN